MNPGDTNGTISPASANEKRNRLKLIVSLMKNIKLDLTFSKFVIKPIVATFMMGICSYYTYLALTGIIAKKMATILAIVLAVIVYCLAIVTLKVFSKEEILMLPSGEKLCKVLTMLKIY